MRDQQWNPEKARGVISPLIVRQLECAMERSFLTGAAVRVDVSAAPRLESGLCVWWVAVRGAAKSAKRVNSWAASRRS